MCQIAWKHSDQLCKCQQGIHIWWTTHKSKSCQTKLDIGFMEVNMRVYYKHGGCGLVRGMCALPEEM